VDNEDIPCELANPSLSSIALRLEEVGTLAATKLDEMMQGRRPDSRGVTRLTVPPGDVVERKSTSAYVSKNPLVVEVFRLIRSDGGHLKNVSDLVQELPAGRRTLEIHFRNDTGHTIYDAIVAQRIRVATRLLRTTDHTNEAIAAEAGFGSVQRLFAHFRKHTGTTPARFRRRLR
jgi:LacI family transcriptional regulator